MITEQLPAWTASWREEGLQQGLEHERELIARLTARKFDAATAGRLSPLLDRIRQPERLADVADWIMDCDQPEDLLARTEGLVDKS